MIIKGWNARLHLFFKCNNKLGTKKKLKMKSSPFYLFLNNKWGRTVWSLAEDIKLLVRKKPLGNWVSKGSAGVMLEGCRECWVVNVGIKIQEGRWTNSAINIELMDFKCQLFENGFGSSGGAWIGVGFQPVLTTLKLIQVQPSEPSRKISAKIHFTLER